MAGKPRTDNSRAAKEARQRRLVDVRALVALQVSHRDIAEQVAAKHGVSPSRVLEKDIKDVYAEMARDGAAARPTRREQAIATWRAMIQLGLKARGGPDLRAAIRAHRELCLMEGLYPAAKQEVQLSGSVSVDESKTTGQLRSELAALMAQREAMMGGNGHDSGEPH